MNVNKNILKLIGIRIVHHNIICYSTINKHIYIIIRYSHIKKVMQTIKYDNYSPIHTLMFTLVLQYYN